MRIGATSFPAQSDVHSLGELANTRPTTLAGVIAVLRLANEIEVAGGDWPDTDTIGRDGWRYQLRATMAAAIEALMKAERAVQA